MGNRSKRRQSRVKVRNSAGYIVGVENRDMGHGSKTKNRSARATNTNTAADREEMNRLRREARRARKGVTSVAGSQ